MTKRSYIPPDCITQQETLDLLRIAPATLKKLVEQRKLSPPGEINNGMTIIAHLYFRDEVYKLKAERTKKITFRKVNLYLTPEDVSQCSTWWLQAKKVRENLSL
jgi:hypothetical protein